MAPSKSCRKLFDLLRTTGNLEYGTTKTITDVDLKKAISPIRAMVTRQKVKQASYGNTFDFDVDAALGTKPTEPEVVKSPPVRLKVVTVSVNHNSFGLKNMIMISDHGQGWQAAANDLNLRKEGTILEVPEDMDISTFLTRQGFEIPQRFAKDPNKKLMAEVWGETSNKASKTKPS
mgnify:CR=1 FL=1